MGQRLGEWLSDRWPFVSVWKAVTVEDIPGGSSYFYSLGSAVLFIFIIQAVTGIIQLFFYVPTVDHAYDSVSFLRFQIPFGWLIHGLHYWGAQAMIILAGLHLSQVFIWGAHKKPREFTWLLGVTNLLLVLTMSFTGAALPWDVKGFWATEVGTNIAGTVPLIGDFIKKLLRGTEDMGQLALDRMFSTHILIIPGLLVLSVLVHLVAFRRMHSAGPWSGKRRLRSGPFWPDQLLKDAILSSIILVTLVALSVWAAAPVTGPADSSDLSVQPKPEWDFLFLYQAIKVFKGPFEPVGTVVLPLAAVVFLFFVPFISKKEERDPLKRLWGLGVFTAALAVVIVLTISGAVSRPGHAAPGAQAGPALAAKPAQPPSEGEKTGGGGGAKKNAAPASSSEGAALFKSAGCIACHKIGGVGGAAGPDLSAEGSRNRTAQWIAEQIQNPKAHKPQSIMPAFASRLKPAEIQSLAEYLLSLKAAAAPAKEAPAQKAPAEKEAPAPSAAPAETENRTPGPAASMIGDAKHGGVLFQQTCARCHGPEGTDKVPNPGSDDGTVPPLNPIDPDLANPDPRVFAAKIDDFIQHGSVPSGPNPAVKMPPFGDSNALTQQAIANLEAYVLSLNHVDRAKIMHPGMSPDLFLLITFFCFAVAGWILWLLLPVRRKSPNPPKG